MSFTDRKPFTVTPDHLKARWSGGKPGEMLRCAWCGHKFTVGDVARWVMTNVPKYNGLRVSGNPFVCQECDGPDDDIVSKLADLSKEFYSERFWWFQRWNEHGD